MGIRDRLRKLGAAAPGRERLARHRDDHGAAPIAEIPLRRQATVAGEITAVNVVSRAGTPSLEVELHDGSGDAVAVFTGRASIPGITTGRRVVVEGVPRRDGERIVMLNPAYRLL